MNRLLPVAAVAAVLATTLSACGNNPDELRDISPVWTGSVEPGVTDLPKAALVGDTVVLSSRDGVWMTPRDGNDAWFNHSFEDLRVNQDEMLAEPPDVTIYDNSVVVSGPEVGTNVLPMDSSEPIYRDDSPGASAVALTESFVTLSCAEGACALVSRNVNDGSEQWKKELEGSRPAFVSIADGPQSIRSQRVDLLQHELGPAEHEVILVRSHQDNSNVMSIDIGSGETLAEFELPNNETFYRFVAPDVILQWGLPDNNCEIVVQGLDVRTGQVAWDDKILFSADESMQFPESCAEGMAGPRISGQMLLAADTDGHPIAIDYSSGEVIWQGDDPEQLAVGYEDGLIVTAQRDDQVDKIIATEVASDNQAWSINVERALTGTWPELGFSSGMLAFNTPGENTSSVTIVSLADGQAATAPDTSHLVSVGTNWVFTLDSLDSDDTRTLSLFDLG